MKLTHAEWCKTLLEGESVAALSSLAEGYPYASLVQYALDPEGHPLLLISDLAEHTHNLKADARASLLVWQSSGRLDPLARGRVTLVGQAEPAPPELLETYLAKQPQARPYAGFKDFHLWRIRSQRLRWVGGFGEMSWVSPQEVSLAQADPVYAFADSVIEHMNEDHRDALQLLLQQHLGQPVASLEMVACDGSGYAVRADGKTVRLEFSRRIRNAEDMRQEFVTLVRAARG